MTTPAPKKPPSTGTPSSRMAPQNPSTPGTLNRSPSRASTASPSAVSRTRSVRGGTSTPLSARSAVKRPGISAASGNSNSSVATDTADEEDSRAETAALISDLEERLQRAEDVSIEYTKQIEVLKTRLDEAVKEQAKLEERVHEEEERVEGLTNEKKEVVREKRELENIYEAERVAVMKEKEDSQAREEELMGVINRLRDRQKEDRPGLDEEGRLSRNSSYASKSSNLEAGHFAPPSSLQRSNSRSDSKFILQKDKVIESLRLELAEAQIKLVEMENAGGGRVQELERILLETRMTNARLMEDNESYQLLLSEKTLNGDFSRGEFMRHTIEDRPPSRAPGNSTSLADELSSFSEEDAEHVNDSDHTRRLEAEVRSLSEEKKALTLYINKIIERLLQHQGFETILSNGPDQPGIQRGPSHADKELPPPPPGEAAQQPSFLQRAKSVLASNTKTRPQSMMMPPVSSNPIPTVTEDPDTAPSIPLQRNYTQRHSSGAYGHKRSGSEWSSAATIVNNMYRSPPADASPGVVSPRNSFFMQPGRATSGSSSTNTNTPRPDSVSSVSSDAVPRMSEDGGMLDNPSPPRSVASSGERPVNAVMAGRTVRPLRLVQEKTEEDQARKAANRASWLGGWFKTPQSGAENQQY